ncbi:MAG: isoprenylcysteine carboxylmethyltransferase family protein [Saprospirales bacterium]|nr:isoprenylcysteine carboxylmethyltransferase family protein [Saprospirales bacterium]MBK8492855.1 isoprenylcysteine carboxylmethyltransferase family protein [Saprospirales bacterium]
MGILGWFGAGSIPLIILSWRALKDPQSHGFYRFFLWEAILGLFLLNYSHWFFNPFAWNQLLSWLFLFFSLYLVLDAVWQLRKARKPDEQRNDPTLYTFEATTALVEKGVFRYIRHPMYSSLLFLAWGIALKDPGIYPLLLALLAGLCGWLTCRQEEKEDIAFFGKAYLDYKQRTKWLIPFVL